MATTSRFAIKQLIVDLYGLGRSGFNDEATGTTAILADDSQFGGHRGADRIEVGCDLLAKQDSTVGGGGTVTFDATRISKRPSFAAGQITVDPVLALGETPDKDDNDTDFLVLYLPFRNEQFNFIIDEVLGEHFMWQKLYVPLTLVTDGDMLASGTSAWIPTVASVAKVVASFPLAEEALRITASGSNGNVISTPNVPVEAGESYYLEVTASIASTGAADDIGTLFLVDITNAANISLTNTSITGFEPVILRNQSVLIPSGCKQIYIQLTVTASGDIIDLSNVIFRKNEHRTFTLQDRNGQTQSIGQVRVTSKDTWATRDWNTMTEVQRTVQQVGNVWQIHLNQSVGNMAVFYEEWVAPGTLANDSSTTIAPKEDVAAVVAERLLLPYHEDKYWRPFYTKAAIKAARVVSRAQGQRSYVNVSQRVQRRQRV